MFEPLEGLQENAVALVDDAMAKALHKRAAELGSSRVAKRGVATTLPSRHFKALGHVAEWLRNGLQNRVPRFNSGRGLQLNH